MYRIPAFRVPSLGYGWGLPSEDANEIEPLHKQLRADTYNVPEGQEEQFERLVCTAVQQLFDLLKLQYRRRGSAFNEYVLDVVLPKTAFQLSLGLGWLPASARADAPAWRHWIKDLLEGRYSQVGLNDSLAVDPYIFVKFPPETIAELAPEPVSSVAARRKPPGPQRDLDSARKVKKIAEEYSKPEGWKDDLEAFCERLDEAGISIPKTWRKREPRMLSWSDGASFEPKLAIKTIKDRLKIAHHP
ncbi:MAG TPA: hypothetical protein VK752_18735 [Bryobacteraceae bacterium]|jgi:hypothetical protein|nr:hypothetical protein [Bryobacteraceae bacterium]